MSGLSLKIPLEDLRRDYLQAKPPTQIKLLEQFRGNSINSATLLQWTVGGENRNCPPIQYRIAFVKYLIKQLELESSKLSSKDEQDDEENEDISMWYDALETLSKCKEQYEPFYRLYDIFDDEDNLIKVFENESAFVVEGTTGLVTWEASTQLAKWLISEKHDIEKADVKWTLELGCGTGFLAIATMKILPNLNRYVITDGHHSALSKCRENFLANYEDLPISVDLEIIDWTKDGKKFQGIANNLSSIHGTGFLFGADIVFDPVLIPPLTRMLVIFLETQAKSNLKGIVILSCTVRNESTVILLKEVLRTRCNLLVDDVHSWENGVILQIKSRDLK